MFTDGEAQNSATPAPQTPPLGAEKWNARYAQEKAVWSYEPNVFIAELVQQFASGPSAANQGSANQGSANNRTPGRAVDLGAGEGRHAIWLAGLGWHVEAVDFSGVGLAKGAANAGELNERITWTMADALTWTPPVASVDLVVLAYLQLNETESAAVIRNVASGLAPGGHIVWVSHDLLNITNGTGGPQMPEILQTPDQVCSWMEAAGLTVELAETRSRLIADAPRPALDCIAVGTLP